MADPRWRIQDVDYFIVYDVTVIVNNTNSVSKYKTFIK